MKTPSQRLLDKHKGEISLSSLSEKNRELIDICFYNKEHRLEEKHDFSELRAVVAKQNLDNYYFIKHHQEYYLSHDKLSKEEALYIIKDNLLVKKIEEGLSKENQEMLLNIAIIDEKIDDVLYLIGKNILPNPQHKNILNLLLKNNRGFEILKTLINKNYEFEEKIEEELIERVAIKNNPDLLSLLLDNQSHYTINKSFTYYLIKIDCNNWHRIYTSEEELDNKIMSHEPILNEFFKRMNYEDVEVLTRYLKKQGVQDKLEKLFNYRQLNKQLANEKELIVKPKI